MNAGSSFEAVLNLGYCGGMWRLLFYGLLAVVWASAASTPYAGKTFSGLVLILALLTAVFYFGAFLWWLRDKSLSDVRPVWRSATLKALDRTALFVGTSMFGAWIAPLKGTIRNFSADPMLARFDYSVFQTEPWRITHALLGPLTTPIDYLYGLWPMVVTISTLGIALFAGEQRLGRFFLGLALSWTLLGIALAHAIPSAGPIFGPDLGFGFDALRQSLDQSAPYSTWAREYLWRAHESGSAYVGSGISAAPSMHCALTFVMCFAAYRSRWFVPACLYAAFIWMGSVHLGWHYFADGLISLIGVAALWPVVRWAARSQRRPLTGLPSRFRSSMPSA